MKKLLVTFLYILSLHSVAQLNIVAVGDAELELSKLIVSRPLIDGKLTADNLSKATELMKVIKNDFSFYQKVFF